MHDERRWPKRRMHEIVPRYYTEPLAALPPHSFHDRSCELEIRNQRKPGVDCTPPDEIAVGPAELIVLAKEVPPYGEGERRWPVSRATRLRAGPCRGSRATG